MWHVLLRQRLRSAGTPSRHELQRFRAFHRGSRDLAFKIRALRLMCGAAFAANLLVSDDKSCPVSQLEQVACALSSFKPNHSNTRSKYDDYGVSDLRLVAVVNREQLDSKLRQG